MVAVGPQCLITGNADVTQPHVIGDGLFQQGVEVSLLLVRIVSELRLNVLLNQLVVVRVGLASEQGQRQLRGLGVERKWIDVRHVGHLIQFRAKHFQEPS